MRYNRFILSPFINLERATKVPFAFLLLFFVAYFFSCKESKNATEPTTSDEFKVEIFVKDSLGNPVPNLRICGGNILSVHSSGQEIGVFWVPLVYITKLIVQDTSQTSILFQDSIYMVYAEIDLAQPGGILGYTSSSGTFVTQNKKRFIGLFNLPEMKSTNSTGPEIMYTFHILDTARFVLYDTVTHKTQTIDRIVKNQSNKYEIIWRPTETLSPSIHSLLRSSDFIMRKESLVSKSSLAATWTLNQNSPNPFNRSTLVYFDIQSLSVATVIVTDFLGEDSCILMNQQRVAQGSYSILYDRR